MYDAENYPDLAGYCILIRDLTIETAKIFSNTLKDSKLYLERVIAESIDVEFRAYMALPNIKTDELQKWFCLESPAIKEIINLLLRHQKKGWVISNQMNPSTKRLLNVRLKKITQKEAIVNTMEYWYLRWWDLNNESYTYPYRETNRQIYILKRKVENWKVFENLRPSPRSSTPHRKKRY